MRWYMDTITHLLTLRAAGAAERGRLQMRGALSCKTCGRLRNCCCGDECPCGQTKEET